MDSHLLEAIERERYVANMYYNIYNTLFICGDEPTEAEYHNDIAEYLEELKQLKEQKSCEDYISREKAKKFLYERVNRLNNDELYDIFSRIIDDMYNELER